MIINPILLSDALYTHQSFFYPTKKLIIKNFTTPMLLSSSLKNNYQNFHHLHTALYLTKNSYQKSPPTLYPSVFSNTKNNHHNNHAALWLTKKSFKKSLPPMLLSSAIYACQSF